MARPGVSPTATIRVSFTKPVQPRDVGEFLSTASLVPATRGLSLSAQIATVSTPVLYYAEPVSMGDFMNYIVTPAFQFPSEVQVTLGVNATINDLVRSGARQRRSPRPTRRAKVQASSTRRSAPR